MNNLFPSLPKHKRPFPVFQLSGCAVLMICVVVFAGCAKKETAKPETAKSSAVHPTTTDTAPVESSANGESTVPAAEGVRFATFNLALNRRSEGQLKKELAGGKSKEAKQLAEIIQRVRPAVLLLNEFDYDEEGQGIKSFQDEYLGVPQNDQTAIEYPHVYFNTVNTGVDSGLDLNGDGKTGTADDAFGFGQFPGKYAMVVLSQHPIATGKVRTFQNFLWKDMPDSLWPIDVASGQPFYSDKIKQKFRLSSKSHWDVPIEVGEKTIHLLVSHPTPPVFDGDEDRNGCRNHDEIRLFADYIANKADYLYDDKGVKGGLPAGSQFIIAGDLNADPFDGDTKVDAAQQLTENLLINRSKTPTSEGGVHYATEQGGKNTEHKGDPAADTGDFNDRAVGNMRIDYCLPSETLKLNNAGVFWPKPDQPGGNLVGASDHRMVWIDVE